MQFRVEYGSDIDTCTVFWCSCFISLAHGCSQPHSLLSLFHVAAVNGSGFPKHVSAPFPAGGGPPNMSSELASYADHGWNLNNLPLLPGSVLHYIGGSVTGITTPWMYIGMVFSSFCWYHAE
jgi:hypothetical protein